MKPRISLRLIALGAFMAGTAHAQDLFLPVAGPELTIVRAENTRYLAERLYVAKRHRIVRINEEALRNNEGKTVFANIFSDVQLEFVINDPLSLERGISDRVRGTLVGADLVVQGFLQADPAMDYATAHRLATSVSAVAISALLWVRDDTDDRYWPALVLEQPGLPGAAVKVSELRSVLAEEDFVLGFSFSITDPATSAQYTLRPLPASPQYHVLWEWDSARSNLKRMDPSAPPLDSAAKARSDSYEQFRRSLGPVRGADTEMEDLGRFLEHLKSRTDALPSQAKPVNHIGEQP